MQERLARLIRIERLEAGRDIREQGLDAAFEFCAVEDRIDRRRHSPARLVAQHHEERRLQVPACILQRAEYLGAEHVAGDANHEKLAEPRVENELGWHSAVAAAKYG